jgi:hypothetical protein
MRFVSLSSCVGKDPERLVEAKCLRTRVAPTQDEGKILVAGCVG